MENTYTPLDEEHSTETCVNCGKPVDGNTALWTEDEKGRPVKWLLCDSGPSPTCYQKWMRPVDRSSYIHDLLVNLYGNRGKTYARWS